MIKHRVMEQKLNAGTTETQLTQFEKMKCGKIQFIYLCSVEGVAVYFSDAVVVQVPAISQVVMIKGEKLLSV